MAVTDESESFALDILSPDATIFSGRCASLLVRTSGGEVEILPRHEPLLSILAPGPLVVRQATGKDKTACAITGGFLHVTGSKVTVLADGLQPRV
ncbi:MAG: ATP synthase F1 subunit epsilon [Lentisphaerae bacterium RIFOXYC12_FULL_60_16]|nr:MAG: ATP synthase F1 subunit epsilon [Lentisphaerae bacterium RIFOXYC12_FULL_60_16]OGV84928.1 MAG: ATP synthase F1 subunit epsilon [Lentisphaerae bacterium RIFOXYB12_FULL_60_10]